MAVERSFTLGIIKRNSCNLKAGKKDSICVIENNEYFEESKDKTMAGRSNMN